MAASPFEAIFPRLEVVPMTEQILNNSKCQSKLAQNFHASFWRQKCQEKLPKISEMNLGFVIGHLNGGRCVLTPIEQELESDWAIKVIKEGEQIYTTTLFQWGGVTSLLKDPPN